MQEVKEKSLGNLRPAPQWQPGQSGNPKGKPKGAIDRLRRNLLKEARKHFDAHGVSAFDRTLAEKPDAYLRIMAALVAEKVESAENSGPTINILIQGVDERL